MGGSLKRWNRINIPSDECDALHFDFGFDGIGVDGPGGRRGADGTGAVAKRVEKRANGG